MFNNKFEEQKEVKELPKKDTIEVKPKRDFRIVQNEHDIVLKEGEKIEVPKKFVQNLKTEGVI